MEAARLDTTLGRILRDEGRTQTWLARRLGVQRNQVWEWVHGLHVPEEATRALIAQALGRHVDDVFPAHSAVRQMMAPPAEEPGPC